MNHHILLIVHLICATIWVGGHLYLSSCILPSVLKQKDNQRLLKFEKSFEPLGLPSLLLLIITGLWMARKFGIQWGDMLAFRDDHIGILVSTKLVLLLATVLFAISAQTWVLPSLRKSPKRLPVMAIHAIGVTLLGLALLTVGSYIIPH